MILSDGLILTQTISVPEVMWTVLSAVGLVIFGKILLRSAGDLLALKFRKINGLHQYAATTYLIIFSALWSMYVIFFAIGVTAMLIPSPNNHVQPLAFILTVAFLILDGCGAAVGIIIYKRKIALLKMIEELEGKSNDTI